MNTSMDEKSSEALVMSNPAIAKLVEFAKSKRFITWDDVIEYLGQEFVNSDELMEPVLKQLKDINREPVETDIVGVDDVPEDELVDDEDDDGIEGAAHVFRERKRSSSKPSVRKNVTDFGKPFFETLEKEKERIREGGCLVTITFDMIGDLYDLAGAGLGYKGETSLYKNTSTGKYLLVIPAEGEEYTKALNFAEAASEFGKARIVPRAGAAFLDKDHECLIGTGALDKIAGEK